MNGWSCSPKHGRTHFTVLKNLFLWLVPSFSKTCELMAGPCSPKHGPVSFTVLKNVFVWKLCTHAKIIKFMAGPCSRTSPVTAQLFSRRWRLVSFWCCANFQQRSNERLVVLPQTRPSSFHNVDDFFYLDGMKLFKNIWTDGWVVLPQTRPSSFHGVEERFRLDVKIFKFMAGPRSPTSPVTAQLILRRWRIITFWCCADFQQRSNERMVVLPQTQSRAFHGVEELSHLHGMKRFKNSRTYGWAVLPQTRPSSFHGVEKSFRMGVMQPCKNIHFDCWAALPNIPCHGPANFAVLKNHFVLMLCRHLTTFKRTAGRAPPNTA